MTAVARRPLAISIARLSRLWRTPRIRPRTLLPVTADDTRARIDFIVEMLERNPAAFASEADLQAMLSVYCGRF